MIKPRADGGDHPIAEARDGGDVCGLFGVIAEQAAKGRNGLVDGVLRDGYFTPDLAEQVIDADDLAGALGEAHEKLHGPRVEPGGLSVAGDLAG